MKHHYILYNRWTGREYMRIKFHRLAYLICKFAPEYVTYDICYPGGKEHCPQCGAVSYREVNQICASCEDSITSSDD